MCYKKKISEMAVKSMVFEVSTTPKPGLVDQSNSGAHLDMDYHLFIKSASSFADCLEEIVEIGYWHKGEDFVDLFNQVRQVGIRAEKQMFESTNGVNTHKGILFSLCVLCGASGYMIKKKEASTCNLKCQSSQNYQCEYKGQDLDPKEVCQIAAKMCAGITIRDLGKLNKDEQLSNGEKLFLEYGVTGIRGEAEAGFHSVLNYGLPVLNQLYKQVDTNLLLIQVLFSLMSQVEDTNILHRHNAMTLNEVKVIAEEFLVDGGIVNSGGLEKVVQLDQEFSSKNISPGGSADLLAVTIFLGLLQGIKL